MGNPLKWQVSVRTNAKNKSNFINKTKDINITNSIKLITLKHNLKKGEVIQETDLQFDYKNKSVGHGYFIDTKTLIGREVNQNLSRGQVIKVRHLKERFTIIKGQSIII